MRMRIFGLAVTASVALLAVGGGQASASVMAVCSSEYSAANGTSTLPATDIGGVQSGCEIGPFVADAGGGTNLAGTPASVGGSPKPNPSIYQFEWSGGNLTIEELLGNNGTGNNIDVELGLASNGLSANNVSLSSPIASVSISGGPSSTPTAIITNLYLATGTYLLDNYLDNSDSLTDPNYAVLFSPVSATPLPATLPLCAGGLGVLGLFGRRKKQKALNALAA
jgi:hypothetical protein